MKVHVYIEGESPEHVAGERLVRKLPPDYVHDYTDFTALVRSGIDKLQVEGNGSVSICLTRKTYEMVLNDKPCSSH